jgi:elongation factor 1 alpha-like protein
VQQEEELKQFERLIIKKEKSQLAKEEQVDHAVLNQHYPEVKYGGEAEAAEVKADRTLNLVIIGHVDSGKSTLMGHLLFKLGQVTPNQMHKMEKISQNYGKSSFKFAYVMDESEEERQRGVTIDVG